MYNGYLIRVNGNNPMTDSDFPYMLASSYKVKRNVMDLEAYRDANGVLHRSALSHNSITVSFQLDGDLTNTLVEGFMSKLRSNYTNSKERRLSITCYVPELNNYITQDMYMPDVEFTIDMANANYIIYEPITLEFIGY